MEHLNNLFTPIAQIITSENFFDYHGLVLSLVWFVACLAAILARRVSPALHGVMFFILDVTTLFFTAGAWIRIYPHLATYQTWSTLKLLHILGGMNCST